MDAQVDAAVADGLQVILMPYRYPQWVNHETRYDGTKSPAYRLPDDGHGPYSRWAAFAEALWARYAGRMAAFEVVNEPNLQLWPQAGVAERVAWMMATVDAIARRHDRAAVCLGPSISDAESDRPWRITERTPFVDALLPALAARGFAGGDHWVWSFHNYNDCELGGDRVSAMRAQLAGRWTGRRAGTAAPLVFATEGGVRLDGVERRLGVTFPPARRRASRRGCSRTRSRATSVRRASGCSRSTPCTPTRTTTAGCSSPTARMRPAFGAWVGPRPRGSAAAGAPICTSSPWCSGASQHAAAVHVDAVEAAVVGDHGRAPAFEHERVPARHGVVVEHDVGARAAADAGQAAERQDDDLVAVGDGEVAAGGEPPDRGGGLAHPVQQGGGAHDGGRRLARAGEGGRRGGQGGHGLMELPGRSQASA